jgi:hypothetical protein
MSHLRIAGAIHQPSWKRSPGSGSAERSQRKPLVGATIGISAPFTRSPDAGVPHRPELVGAEQVPGLVGQRAVDRDEVGLREELIEADPGVAPNFTRVR